MQTNCELQITHFFSDEGTFDLDDEEKEEPTFDVPSMPMYLQLYDALLEVLKPSKTSLLCTSMKIASVNFY